MGTGVAALQQPAEQQHYRGQLQISSDALQAMLFITQLICPQETVEQLPAVWYHGHLVSSVQHNTATELQPQPTTYPSSRFISS